MSLLFSDLFTAEIVLKEFGFPSWRTLKEREEKADSFKVNVFLKHSGHGRGGNVGVASIQMEVYLCNQIEKVEGIFFFSESDIYLQFFSLFLLHF